MLLTIKIFQEGFNNKNFHYYFCTNDQHGYENNNNEEKNIYAQQTYVGKKYRTLSNKVLSRGNKKKKTQTHTLVKKTSLFKIIKGKNYITESGNNFKKILNSDF